MQTQPTADITFDAKTADIVRRAFRYAADNPHLLDWASMSTPPRNELRILTDRLMTIPPAGGALPMTRAQFDGYLSFASHLSTVLPVETWHAERAYLEALTDAHMDRTAPPPSLQDTRAWVRDLHLGQTDKAGRPYVEHVLRVHQRLTGLFPDASPDAEHAALLHDAIEDCDVSAGELRRRGYSDQTVSIVEAVTKRPDIEQTYAERIDHLARTGPLGAIQVKIADLSDNRDPARLALLPGDKAASLGERYGKALDRLYAAISGQPRQTGE
ncbi:HD domain-containing protein [Pseudooceanicola sp. C21-150M6]|uniref:HD domain-containing protein n=1 Tax=Pseudooceanicola sp. C21-150M6 TaxID=3434355 RepID=UPI003D7FDC9B